jgi:hypothetical protein
VTKTAKMGLAGDRYQVDPSPVGCCVELRYDPEGPQERFSVCVEGWPTAITQPYVIDRHLHPAVP